MRRRDGPAWKVSLYRRDEHLVVHQPGTPEQRAERFDLEANPLETGDPMPVEWDSEDGRALAEELELVRRRFAALRAEAPARSSDEAVLTALDEAELEALGYAGFDAERADGDESRLCLDGCAWRP
jgi:hypothetical protein